MRGYFFNFIKFFLCFFILTCGFLVVNEVRADTCSHDMCTAGAALTEGCDDYGCTPTLCAIDSWCCTNSWDSACINEVYFYCGLTLCTAVCGNSSVETGEGCDDGNTSDGDGCSSTCSQESGYSCSGDPSVCTTTCGDGVVAGTEECDDGNTTSGDGCDANCNTESSSGTCGDGNVDSGEECDDGNTTSGDGCDANCNTESSGGTCGDGNVDSGEECDDGNTTSGDGCDANCQNENFVTTSFLITGNNYNYIRNSSGLYAVFQITLSEVSESLSHSISSLGDSSVTVNYATQDGSASATGVDYVETSGALTFTASENIFTVRVLCYEQGIGKSFSLVLFDAQGASIASSEISTVITSGVGEVVTGSGGCAFNSQEDFSKLMAIFIAGAVILLVRSRKREAD